MAEEGDGNVGQIVGYLRLNIDDWMGNAERADARGKQLGKDSPTVKVTADIDEAMAAFAAVRAGEARIDRNPNIVVDAQTTGALSQLAAVSAATDRLKTSQDRLADSQAKLAKLEATEGASEEKIAAARKDVDKATRSLATANLSAAAAYSRMDDAAKKAADEVAKLGPNGPGGPGAGVGAIGAAAEGSGASLMQVLLPALLLVSTTIGPLAAVGAGAFGTILLGSKQLENQVKTGLTPAFHALQTEAAAALEPGVNAAVTQLKGALPQLTPLVVEFGTEIGNAGAEFATWLNDGGVKDFVNYAEQELPIVEGTFSSLTAAVVGFFEDATPVGNDLLRTVTAISDGVAKAESLMGQFESGRSSDGTGGAIANVLGGTTYSGYPRSNDTTGGELENMLSRFEPHNVLTFLESGGSPSGSPNDAAAKQAKATAAAFAKYAAQFAANQAHAGALAGPFNFGNTLPVDAAALGGSLHDITDSDAGAAASTIANQIAAMGTQFANADPEVQSIVGALDTFGQSAGTTADRAKLLGSVLVATQGDLLSYSGAVAQGYAADSALVQTFQQQASELAQQNAAAASSASANAQTHSSAALKSAAASDRLTAAEDRLNTVRKNSKSTAAQVKSAEATVLSAKASSATATAALGKSTSSAASSAGIAFADTELGAINLKEGLINLSAQGAGPLIQQLQAMQSGAEGAAEATYQHEVATQGQAKALKDAQTIFESMTGGTLVANAKELGITADQAKKLADNYFAVPGDVSTLVQSVGLADVNTTLQTMVNELALLTGQTWLIKTQLLADDSTTLGPGGLHGAVNDIPPAAKLPAPTKKPPIPHGYGGYLTEGMNLLGDRGPEMVYKNGGQVKVLNAAQSQAAAGGAASGSGHNAGPSVLQSHITVELDGRVLAKTVNEVNLRRTRK